LGTFRTSTESGNEAVAGPLGEMRHLRLTRARHPPVAQQHLLQERLKRAQPGVGVAREDVEAAEAEDRNSLRNTKQSGLPTRQGKIAKPQTVCHPACPES
jgi:hypothetical protein